MKYFYSILFLALLISCQPNKDNRKVQTPADHIPRKAPDVESVSLIILGTVQDAGSPQIACKKDCCKGLFKNADPTRKVVSIGVVDPFSNRKFLFEATPDMVSQCKRLSKFGFDNGKEVPDGIFVTHAHIGHYTGLMYLGKEAMNADSVPVYTFPKMKSFLETNGPWSQLVSNGNIWLQETPGDRLLPITEKMKVMAYTVPHRDEFSETAGYIITGEKKAALFIPDIDKWHKWDKDIIKEIAKVDYAFIDATFYDGEEINNRDISEIPHPFIIETMELFKNLSDEDKKKIHFIHFNHTNPVLNKDSKQTKQILKNGFNIARYNDVFEL